ncbi:hypothetical protein TTSV1_gp37 [Thermoproteus tenax spherical virus 1]|uniref:Uncharacterized protein n=1 Tax=Thermoproteus tenax spherical virus 1 TaxID=292639 RepID=Q647C5_9VIRU|nr:hypothetical protein TTSV1_gp37 [Thermoproteus tenax spherical virus 1]AAU25987.1 hypothetical protein [Thermoproteus tenax spherical virus 1]
MQTQSQAQIRKVEKMCVSEVDQIEALREFYVRLRPIRAILVTFDGTRVDCEQTLIDRISFYALGKPAYIIYVAEAPTYFNDKEGAERLIRTRVVHVLDRDLDVMAVYLTVNGEIVGVKTYKEMPAHISAAAEDLAKYDAWESLTCREVLIEKYYGKEEE